MTYLGRKTPADTLTAPENAAKTGGYTHRSWHKLSVLEARSKFYESTEKRGKREHPMKRLVAVARETSGAINGEFRKDLVEAMKAPASPTLGLAVAGQAAPAKDAKKDGGGV